MKFGIKEIINNNFFHIGILLFIIIMVIFAVCLVSIKYDVEGETNMPYILSKIAIISSSQGNDKEEKVDTLTGTELERSVLEKKKEIDYSYNEFKIY